MQKLVKITTIFTLSVGLLGVGAQPVAAQAKTVKAQITLTVDHKKISQKKVTTTSKTTLMKVMKKTYKVKDDDGMITAINGHKQNTKTQKYWMYKINGKQAPKGAAQTYLKANDKVSFTLNASK
ncbi:DUF4430 domain-containing protein [Loigolactobacillus zhaoyuanensis]|uniref:DUF4430 domain-containing protein n=1 Tax=Loigolactobacillus zhaoyuanensis TaxID=2486017 RepID=UPI000F736D76|nr:DUF4430 domain-containing protein [Loigolactobacillus zhaoyuanensis]